jgi:hypothetical protein
VFSVIVLINIASINCAAATRQLEGEFTFYASFFANNLYDFEF